MMYTLTGAEGYKNGHDAALQTYEKIYDVAAHPLKYAAELGDKLVADLQLLQDQYVNDKFEFTKQSTVLIGSTLIPGPEMGVVGFKNRFGVTRKTAGPVFQTYGPARKHAETMGYKEVSGFLTKANQKVLHNKKNTPKYITRDIDGHHGGAYKGANTALDLNSDKTRLGTYDKDLNWIAK